jgi:hypothetical protein
MNSPGKYSYKIPLIWLDSTSKPAYSIFNSNNWAGNNSKAIITSCAAQYSLLEYQATKLPSLIQYSRKICELRFKELQNQWDKLPWDVNKSDYLVEVPEFHLNIQAYLATIKIFLDLIVQLISSEGIVNTAVQGFHKKGEIIGGKLLNILENNAKQEKSDTARKLLKFIAEQKNVWVDQAVNVRGLLVHPDEGMHQVMFRLDIGYRNGKLKLQRVLQPSLAGMQFDQYAQITLMQVEYFSKNFLELLKAA